MIKDIKEINFPSYATLSQATVTINEMGDKTITATVSIDGRVKPDFKDWTLEFHGEKYILPIREPQALKSNESLCSAVDLTFYEWVSYQLKRYYFVQIAPTAAGVPVADKYKASLGLTLPKFSEALQQVLDYYYGGDIVVDLNPEPKTPYSGTPVFISIDYSYIWDVLGMLYESYEVRWNIAYDATTKKHVIRIGYPAAELSHTFEYGFKGGLLKIERQVQSDSIRNIILGRGGDRNLPKLYFKDYEKYKPETGNWSNGQFEPDPDAVPELRDVYIDTLRDINFRRYIQGWKAQKGYDGATYKADQGWAYEKGYTDEKFAPVEYVKDDESIAKYGEQWGALDANDDIYPSIQGVTVDPYGRVDEVVAVEEVTSDDTEAYANSEAVKMTVPDIKGTVVLYPNTYKESYMYSEVFEVKYGQTGVVSYVPGLTEEKEEHKGLIQQKFDIFVVKNKEIPSGRTKIDWSTWEKVPAGSVPTGSYRVVYKFKVWWGTEVNCTDVDNYSPTSSQRRTTDKVTLSLSSIKCDTSRTDVEAWKPTFDIWVKNIWGTQKENGETDSQYAERVWSKILGDRDGAEAAVVFSTGWLAVSSDYSFSIIDFAYDTSKELNGVKSEWKLTLAKTDAELEATGLWIPNAKTGGNANAGDYFYFTGIDMPFQYVLWAEEKLNQYKTTEGLGANANVQPTWTVTLDKVRIHSKEDGVRLVDSLEVGGLVSITDKRFTDGKVLQFFISTITYNWTKDSILPEVEINLSDKVYAVKSAVETLRGEISVIRNQYVTTENIKEVVEPLVASQFLRKSGTKDTSYSPTEFASTVSDRDFTAGGVGGSGWGIYKDVDGKAVAEFDKLVVRDSAEFNNLVINQISAEGGKQILSAASIECVRVDDTADGYVCYFDQKRGSVGNLFVVDDIAMGQRFDTDNSEESFYRRRVTAVGNDTITLSKSDVNGEGIPQVGDIIVQYGNYTTPSRQYIIVRDVVGGGFERMVEGLDSVSATGREYYFAGTQTDGSPRFFVGDKNGSFIEYDAKTGQFLIKAMVQFQEGSGGLEQITEWAENFTAIKGGLVLTSEINLGESVDDQFEEHAGINGKYNPEDEHGGTAAWFGGDKTTAKTKFNMDGTGYLSGGNIRWNEDGSGFVAGGALSWDENGVPKLDVDGIKLAIDGADTNDTMRDLVFLVKKFSSMFTREGSGTPEDPYVIRANHSLYSEGGLSAFGKGTGGSGGGGGAAFDLLQSWSDYDSAEAPQQALSAGLGHDLKETKADKTYVDKKVADMVNGAPETLDTLQELSKALGDDPNFAATVAEEIGKKADKSDIPTSLPANGGTADKSVADQNGNNIADTYFPISGGLFKGNVRIGDYPLLFRKVESTNGDGYDSGVYSSTPGNEATVFATKNTITSWIFTNGLDPKSMTDWQNLSAYTRLQIKKKAVGINKFWGNNVSPDFDGLDVVGKTRTSVEFIEGTQSLKDKYMGRNKGYTFPEIKYPAQFFYTYEPFNQLPRTLVFPYLDIVRKYNEIINSDWLKAEISTDGETWIENADFLRLVTAPTAASDLVSNFPINEDLWLRFTVTATSIGSYSDLIYMQPIGIWVYSTNYNVPYFKMELKQYGDDEYVDCVEKTGLPGMRNLYIEYNHGRLVTSSNAQRGAGNYRYTICIRREHQVFNTPIISLIHAPREWQKDINLFVSKSGFNGVTFNVPLKLPQGVDGNATSATKLQTPRKIWGKDFDGTADVDGPIKLNGTTLTPKDNGKTVALSLPDKSGALALLTDKVAGADLADSVSLTEGKGDSARYVYFADTAASDSAARLARSGKLKFNPETGTLYAESLMAAKSVKIGPATLSYDSENDAIKIDRPIYSTGGVSAYGVGNGGSEGGGGTQSGIKHEFLEQDEFDILEASGALVDDTLYYVFEE